MPATHFICFVNDHEVPAGKDLWEYFEIQSTSPMKAAQEAFEEAEVKVGECMVFTGKHHIIEAYEQPATVYRVIGPKSTKS